MICDQGHLAERPAREHSYRGVGNLLTRQGGCRTALTDGKPSLDTADPRRPTMQHETAEILAAIQAGDTPADDFGHLKLPDSYRARHRARRRGARCSRPGEPRQGPAASPCTWRTSPTPELGPGEAVVAVMASAINYNSVWTSIFEPVSTFSFLRRYGRVSELTRRHDLPYHVIGSDLAGVVLRVGAGREQVEARRRGRRALPERGAGGRRGPRRHHARPAAAHLGLRDQLRRPGATWRWSRPTS